MKNTGDKNTEKNEESRQKSDAEILFDFDLEEYPSSLICENFDSIKADEIQYTPEVILEDAIFRLKFDFLGKEEVHKDEAEKPIDFFNLFFTKDLLKIIKIMTNQHREKYASNIKPISVSEIKKYIGIKYFMSICVLPQYEMYWERGSGNFGQETVYNTLSRSRFEDIKTHFSVYKTDDSILKPGDSTLADNIIAFFNKVFSERFKPGRDLSIDEGVCPFKGKLRFKTYNPMKPDRYGIKCYMICDSKSGYLLKIRI